LAQRVGAQVFVDAVHFAPHGLIDVASWGCDYVACSAYKFFGPHVGILWGRRELLEAVTPYKLRPAPDSLPGRWQTGTQNFSAIAGTLEAIEYLADVGRAAEAAGERSRREALRSAYAAIEAHEQTLIWRLIEGLGAIEGITIFGITDANRRDERMPTISLVSDRWTPAEMAGRLAEHGVSAWHGHYYAWELHHALEREPHGMLRLGVVHYNTAEEIDRTVELLHAMHA
jgi:selenocysteine lyase/cysteine desulfurase